MAATRIYRFLSIAEIPLGRCVDVLRGEFAPRIHTIEARFAEFGYATFPNSPAEFEQTITSDIRKWAQVIRFASIKPD